MKKYLLFLITTILFAQEAPTKQQGSYDTNKFSQNYDLYATPNMFRTASGAPGPGYYQQKADYVMNIVLDDKNKRIYGEETVTYHNNSPDKLEYLWLQLDQNIRQRDNEGYNIDSKKLSQGYTPTTFVKDFMDQGFDGGFKIEYVKNAKGEPLSHTINHTMMRLNLEKPLLPNQSYTFSIKWWYNINDYSIVSGRSGYEQMEGDNRIYVIAQFFPRMAVYNDVEGWQNMQFWGRGEFALTFGDYDVKITTPADHVLEATGELQNRKDVFTKEQLKRYELAQKTFDNPIYIVTPEEAKENEKGFSDKTKTWHFKAQNVRDFGFASSRKFMMDAMAVKLETTTPMAISLFPNEANPLWEDYSTRAVAQTLKTYSKHTFDYPYPKAVSVSAENQGMEYPMICWNYGRPDSNGYIPDYIKYGMIGVIIHEVGHNYFPMIVNSDERQWSWMDEGLNTFLQYLTEKEFMDDFPSRRGPADKIVPYMKGDQTYLEPIMSNSEVIHQFGPNAYSKPATALNILRETIMGRDLFDFAFKTYANRWMFKHPTPEDFFRTMEDASAVDLDWFWRGWFYSTDYTDIAIKEVNQYYLSNEPTQEQKKFSQRRGRFGTAAGPFVYMIPDNHEELKDKYKQPFKLEEVELIKNFVEKNYTQEQIDDFKQPAYFYEVTFELIGGLIMPVIVDLEFEDGTKERHKFREQIWRKNNKEATRVFSTSKKVVKIQLDPDLETADIDVTNNVWPKEEVKSKFD